MVWDVGMSQQLRALRHVKKKVWTPKPPDLLRFTIITMMSRDTIYIYIINPILQSCLIILVLYVRIYIYIYISIYSTISSRTENHWKTSSKKSFILQARSQKPTLSLDLTSWEAEELQAVWMSIQNMSKRSLGCLCFEDRDVEVMILI